MGGNWQPDPRTEMFASRERTNTMKILLSWLAAAALLPAAPREPFDSHTMQTVMAPMRDGVRLATDVYLPARNGKTVEGRFPVLLERTPYNKNGRRKLGPVVAPHGYAVLVQDCRGRYASEGQFTPFDDGEDGYDTIEWAAAQPWSNGQVGTFGGSYTGMNQYSAATFRPPHLVGMFIQMAGASLYESVSYPGGAPNASWVSWILRSAATSPQAKQKPESAARIEKTVAADFGNWLKTAPLSRAALLNDFPDYLALYRASYDHASLDEFWKQRRFYTAGFYREMKDVPTLFVTGWYDNFAEGTLEVFSTLSRLQKTEKKLMVGPWPHGIGTSECGNAAFGSGATEDQAKLVAEWFDYLLRKLPLETIGAERVQTYRMGGGGGTRTSGGKLNHGGEWHNAPSWPPPGATASRYYLHDGGLLRPASPSNSEPSSYEFDPRNPVPTIGGRFAVGGVPMCIQDQVCSPRIPACKDALPLNRRPDVLSYSTAPLAAPQEVTGRIHATLWISSDAPDTDFTAKLMDVYPDGYALILADGEIRTRFRNGFDKPELMQPGTVYPVTIDLGSTSNLFGAGHRIRVDISSSNFPKFEPNSNTGEPVNAWTRQVTARNTVYHDAKRPSYIELPFVK